MEDKNKRDKLNKVAKALSLLGAIMLAVGFAGFILSILITTATGRLYLSPVYFWVLAFLGIFFIALASFLQRKGGNVGVDWSKTSFGDLLNQNNKKDEKTTINSDIKDGKCPNCSAMLEETENGYKCPYCGGKFRK